MYISALCIYSKLIGKHNFTPSCLVLYNHAQGQLCPGGFMLNTNNKLKVADLPNNRARKLAWMREGYRWHLIFTDHMAKTMPVFGILESQFEGMQTAFGNNDYKQCQQGPPTGATTNA
jgi:hypothetical protein